MITKTETLKHVTVDPAALRDPADTETVIAVATCTEVTLDDPADAALPIMTTVNQRFFSGDDVSGEPELVQTICAAVWA
mgnify:FL=1